MDWELPKIPEWLLISIITTITIFIGRILHASLFIKDNPHTHILMIFSFPIICSSVLLYWIGYITIMYNINKKIFLFVKKYNKAKGLSLWIIISIIVGMILYPIFLTLYFYINMELMQGWSCARSM